MSAQRPKRREILIDADLQVGMSMHILGWLYFYLVVFAVLANAPSIWITMTADAGDDVYFEAVQRLHWFLRYSVIPLAITFVCVGAHCIAFSHRIAGPVYRFKVTLRDLARRKLPAFPIQLRRKDYFKDLAADMNTAIDVLREDTVRQRTMNADTIQVARDLVAELERGADQRRLLALAHLALDRAEHLDRHLAELATPPAVPADQAPPCDGPPSEPAAAKTELTAAAVAAANS
jgi:hypothetical protein